MLVCVFVLVMPISFVADFIQRACACAYPFFVCFVLHTNLGLCSPTKLLPSLVCASIASHSFSPISFESCKFVCVWSCSTALMSSLAEVDQMHCISCITR